MLSDDSCVLRGEELVSDLELDTGVCNPCTNVWSDHCPEGDSIGGEHGINNELMSFAEYCGFVRRCINTEDSGPTEKEFFGRKLSASERTMFWHKIRQVWNGKEQPPGEMTI